MSTSTVRARALACVSGERVRLLAARPTITPQGYAPAGFVRAEVAASQPGRPPARVQLDGSWSCSRCELTGLAPADRDGQCKHVAIVALLTGWPSAAAKDHRPRAAPGDDLGLLRPVRAAERA